MRNAAAFTESFPHRSVVDSDDGPVEQVVKVDVGHNNTNRVDMGS